MNKAQANNTYDGELVHGVKARGGYDFSTKESCD